jgi:hypothetical protein
MTEEAEIAALGVRVTALETAHTELQHRLETRLLEILSEVQALKKYQIQAEATVCKFPNSCVGLIPRVIELETWRRKMERIEDRAIGMGYAVKAFWVLLGGSIVWLLQHFNIQQKP